MSALINGGAPCGVAVGCTNAGYDGLTWRVRWNRLAERAGSLAKRKAHGENYRA